MRIDRSKVEIALAQKSMTQRELSRRSGVSVSTLWRLFHGENGNPATIGMICHALGILPTEILDIKN